MTDFIAVFSIAAIILLLTFNFAFKLGYKTCIKDLTREIEKIKITRNTNE